MRKTVRKIVLTSILLAVCGATSAIPITDRIDPSQMPTITAGSPHIFTHDITNGLDAFVVGFDTITSAVLSIHLIDNLTKGNEEFSFTIGSGDSKQTFPGMNLNNGALGDWYYVSLGDALIDLIVDGRLRVELTAASGSYEFADSTLTAEVTRGVVAQPAPASIPEPGSLLLLGAGLVGLGMTGRNVLARRKPR